MPEEKKRSVDKSSLMAFALTIVLAGKLKVVSGFRCGRKDSKEVKRVGELKKLEKERRKSLKRCWFF